MHLRSRFDSSLARLRTNHPRPVHSIIRTTLIALVLCAAATLAEAQTTFDHDHSAALTVVGVAGDLLTEGFPGAPGVAIPAAVIGLVPGDEIDALSFGDDNGITGFHQIIFSVSPRIPAFPVAGTGVDFENTTDTAPGVPPAACGDLFLQSPQAGGPCTNVLCPGGFGYLPGTATGDEANAAWASPNAVGAADDLDAFDFSPPTAATGIYFSLAPGSPSLASIPATPGDILFSPLGGGPVTVATLSGVGPATDVNLGIAGFDLDALNCVAMAPGVIAAGPVGPTPCSPGGGTHVLEFSIANFAAPFVHLPSEVLGVSGPGTAMVLTSALDLGLCPSPTGCGAFGDLDNLNALEVATVPGFGTLFDHDHGVAATPVGVAGDLLTEGFPGSPNVAILAAMIGLVPGDEIDAVSLGDEATISVFHQLIFSVDRSEQGLPGSGVNFEFTVGTAPSLPGAGPNPPEAAGDLFQQVAPPPGGPGNILAPAGLGYNAGTGTGDERNAAWVTPAGPVPFDNLDAFDYGPPVNALVTGVYFSLAPGSPSLATIPATPGDILWSPLGGGPVTIATLQGAGPATDVRLGIPGADLDALNCLAASPGVIAAGAVGPTPAGGGGSSHLIEYSVSFFGAPPFLPSDVLSLAVPGLAQIQAPSAALGLCNAALCDGIGNLDALEDPPDGTSDVPDGGGVTSPEGARLALQVTPNPIAEAAEVRFVLSRSEEVRVEVFDAVGRKVGTLHEGTSARGDHRLSWNPGGVANGVYFVRVMTPSGIALQQVTLVR